jgi:hypothetical protein
MKTVREILYSNMESDVEWVPETIEQLCSAVDGLKKERPRNLNQDEFRAGYSQAIEDVKAMIRR